MERGGRSTRVLAIPLVLSKDRPQPFTPPRPEEAKVKKWGKEENWYRSENDGNVQKMSESAAMMGRKGFKAESSWKGSAHCS
jgi:hypothetical protein